MRSNSYQLVSLEQCRQSITHKDAGQGFFSMYLQVAIAMVLSLVYLDIPGYIYMVNPSIFPKYFYYALFVIIAPILLVKFREFLLYMASPYSLWVFAEIVINTVYPLDTNEAVVDLIKELDQFLILSIMFGFIASVIRTESYEGLFPILATIIPVCTIIDFMLPESFYPFGTEGTVVGRASAMYINPTRTGEAILIICLLAIPVMRKWYRMPLLFLAGVGLFVTFSRGPILGWMLFWIFLLITRTLPKYSFVFSVAIIAILSLSLNSFKSYILGRQDLEGGFNNLIERLDFFKTKSLEDDSAQSRLEALMEGVRVFLENPILGAGTGATTFWSHGMGPHNQIAVAAAEHGIFGIILWMWLIFILWRGRYFQDNRFQLVAATGTFFMSFFNHNMLTTFYWLLMFALVSGRRKA